MEGTILRYIIAVFTVFAAAHVNCADAATVYRWTDRMGQVHLSDQAPGSGFTRDELQMPDELRSDTKGLRKAEIQVLQKLQRRTTQQHRLAQARRLKASREQAEHLKRCDDNRKKLQLSRGRGNYKQYARYLRKHCW